MDNIFVLAGHGAMEEPRAAEGGCCYMCGPDGNYSGDRC